MIRIIIGRYNLIGEEDVLKHSFRKVLYEYVVEHPGSSFKILHSVFNVPPGTLRYHLLKLERTDKVIKKKNGNRTIYYSSFQHSNDYQDPQIEISKKQSLLLEIIKNKPGLRTNILAQRSGLSKKDLYYNLRKLREKRLIWKVKGNGYQLLRKEKLRKEISLILIDQFLEGKIDRDKFDSLMSRLDIL